MIRMDDFIHQFNTPFYIVHEQENLARKLDEG